jgi:hypothetical protein
MEKSKLNNIENFNLNREIDLFSNNIDNKLLNDREIFNKFSNSDEQKLIDMAEINYDDKYGMPIFNGQILQNKKNLISNPFIIENNDKDNFISNYSSFGINDTYAEIESNNNVKFDNDIFNNMAYNNMNNIIDIPQNINKNTNISSNNIPTNISNNIPTNIPTNISTNIFIDTKPYDKNYICNLEKDIMDHEYIINLNKNKDFLVDLSSPFVIAYMWKCIVLLTKNPSMDYLLKMLKIDNKENFLLDMKYNSDLFKSNGNIKLIIPTGNQRINSNYIKKIEDIYKIKIIELHESFDNKAIININYIFNLEIPFYYEPKIINGYMEGYNKNKIKFLELKNVPIYLLVDQNKNIVILEIPCASNITLGFIYSLDRSHTQIIPYELLLKKNKVEILVKTLVIPKINRNKMINYSKNFTNELNDIYFGELIYENKYNLNMNIKMGLNIDISNKEPSEIFEINREIEYININHKCYYYIKNNNIENKILLNGIINYKL